MSKKSKWTVRILSGIAVILLAVIFFMLGNRSQSTSQQTATSSSKVTKTSSAKQTAKSTSRSSSSQPQSDQYTDDEYQMMAFLKFYGKEYGHDDSESDHEAAMEMLDEFADSTNYGEDSQGFAWRVVTNPNGHVIDFSHTHEPTVVMDGENVKVLYDKMGPEHMGHNNGLDTFSKTELANEFGQAKGQIDEAIKLLNQHNY